MVSHQLQNNLSLGYFHVTNFDVSNFECFLVRREKIGTLKQNASVPIIVDNPHVKQGSKSEKIIHLVNQYEMRVAKPDLVEKGIKRDLQQNGTNLVSDFTNY